MQKTISMLRILRTYWWVALLAVAVQGAGAFTLIGPREPYQTIQLGYIGDGYHLEAVLPQDTDERPPEGEIGIEDNEPRCGHPAMNLANTASSTLPPEAITATGPFGR